MVDTSKGCNWFVAVDGSVMSEIACDTVMKDLMREEDNLVVGHVEDKAKTYLPMKMKSHYIKTTYETKILTQGHNA